jgi:hypothetical protein
VRFVDWRSDARRSLRKSVRAKAECGEACR